MCVGEEFATHGQASPSNMPRAIVAVDASLVAPRSHKKLRSSPQHKSEEQIPDFYQKLERERVKQTEMKQDAGIYVTVITIKTIK